MQISLNQQNTDAWYLERRGVITGSKLGDLVVYRGNKRKIGFYEIMAERIGIKDDSEDPMERGHDLEPVAIETFELQTGKKVTKVGLCKSDKNPYIGLSPDGFIENNGKYTEAVEVKCLSSANHLRAYFEKEIPSDYEEQVVQYFIVNEDLETLHFVFFDPRITALPYFVIKVERAEVADRIKELEEYQIKALAEMDEMINQLTF